MVCVEVASAAYVFDGTIGTSVVNSLFGDGAAAVAVSTGQGTRAPLPQLVKFSSHIITDAIDSMSFTWDDSVGKYDFYLSLDVPYVVGANAETAVARLLDGTGIRLRDVAHWVVHSGGKKVADSLRVNLGLTHYDVRHTMSVLHDYGNLSSGSFLYSYQRLMDEGVTRPGEYGVMMTMGPGSTIETALVRF
jgi:alkylresorcinol/alkylpyrone synthase/polyketide synthase Type III